MPGIFQQFSLSDLLGSRKSEKCWVWFGAGKVKSPRNKRCKVEVRLFSVNLLLPTKTFTFITPDCSSPKRDKQEKGLEAIMGPYGLRPRARPLPSHSQLAANKLCTHAGLNACTQPTVLTQKCSGHGQNQGCGTLHNGGFSVSISSARRSTAFFSHFSPPLRSNEVDSSKDPQSLARARAHSRANKSVVRWFLLRVWMHWGDRQSGVLFTMVHDMSDILNPETTIG